MKRLRTLKAAVVATLALAILAAVVASQALGGSEDASGAAKGLGALSGVLPRDHLTLEVRSRSI